MKFWSSLFLPRIPIIILDGVCFEWPGVHGIARVWTSLLKEWSGTAFGQSLVVLDRNDSAPKFAGFKYIQLRSYREDNAAQESFFIEEICRQFNANLFVSTNHTTPIETPSALMVHDLIPERWPGFDRAQPWIREKIFSTYHASAYLAISENTASELKEEYPFTAAKTVRVSYNGVNDIFKPVSPDAVTKIKEQYGLTKPYFLCVGERTGHKNTELLFKALGEIQRRESNNPPSGSNQFAIVCCGGKPELEPELKILYDAKNISVKMLMPSDQELNALYGGSRALVFPSLMEGFGLPIIEAMASGCPVITCCRSAIPAVAGNAALYIKPNNTGDMIQAMIDIGKEEIREPLIQAGLARATLFSWRKMADAVAKLFIETALACNGFNRREAYRLWRILRHHQRSKDCSEQKLKELELAYCHTLSGLKHK